MTRRVLLVRHPPVAPDFAGVCYGSSDVPLGTAGEEQARDLARVLAVEPMTHLFHSGLARCEAVAKLLSAMTGVVPLADARLRERCFGSWELRPWDDIYAETGDAMLGMVSAPGVWHPPDGETTFAVRDRIVEWYGGLPVSGLIVAVMHGCPIAALRGTLTETPVSDWPKLIPPLGTVVEIGCRTL
jgi:broad specificity phosphatase PhoE